MKFRLLTLVPLLISFSSIAQWTEVSLPSVNPVNPFVSTDNYLFTYDSPGGIFRSNDNGISWIRSMNGVAPTREYNDLLSWNGKLYISSSGNGVFISEDEGGIWTLANDLPTADYNSFTVHNEKVFAITSRGEIFMTENDGQSWGQVSDPEIWNNNAGTDQRRIFSSGSGNLLIFGEDLLFQSEDDGASWIETSLDNSIGTITVVNDVASNSNSLWVSAVSENLGPILLYSSDDGASFNLIDIEGNFWPRSIAVNDQYVAYTLLGGIYYSADNGQSWNSSFEVSSESINYSSSAGFYLTSDEATSIFDPATETFSSYQSSGINSYRFTSLFDQGDNLIIHTAAFEGIWSSFDKENETLNTLPALNSNSNNFLSDLTFFNGVFHGLYQGEIYQYESETQSWVASFQHPNDGSFRSLTSTGSDFYAGESSLFISTEDSNILTDLEVPLQLNGVLEVYQNDTLTIISADQLNISHNGSDFQTYDPDRFIADYWATEVVNSKIFTSTINGFFWSDDLGVSWNEISTTLFGNVRSIKFFEQRLYIATNHGVFVSVDEGQTWIAKNKGQNFFQVRNLLFDDDQVYSNTIGGGLWKRPIDDLYTPPTIEGVNRNFVLDQGETIVININDLVVTDDDSSFPDDFELIIIESDVYTIQDNNTILPVDPQATELAVSVQVSDGRRLSNQFEIDVIILEPLNISQSTNAQIFPNPTTSSVKIKIDREGAYDIQVFDMSGKIILNALQKADGQYLEVNVSKLARGSYLLKLVKNDFREVYRILKN